jgi:hypothetical protein
MASEGIEESADVNVDRKENPANCEEFVPTDGIGRIAPAA